MKRYREVFAVEVIPSVPTLLWVFVVALSFKWSRCSTTISLSLVSLILFVVKLLDGSAVPPDPIFNSIAFLNQCDEDYYKFLDVFLATMTFNNFIQLSKDEEDEHIDIDYFGELMSIYSKEGEEAVFDFISPKNWNLVDITIPPPTGDGLPEKYRTFFIFNF